MKFLLSSVAIVDRGCARDRLAGLGTGLRPGPRRTNGYWPGRQSSRGPWPLFAAVQSAGRISWPTRYAGVAIPRFACSDIPCAGSRFPPAGDYIGGATGAPAGTGFNAP